tara:strand:- start:2247 stop:3314 length:1068 start_codon:yes stop_codon:yes gene_type:complete
MIKNKYDYIILGGGCAGLSLAYHLNTYSKLNSKTLCIVEKRDTYKRDKTWSFWDLGYNPFEDCVTNSWKSFKVINKTASTTVCSEKFPYVSIDSSLFYKKILNDLSSNKNISFKKSPSSVDLDHGIVFNSFPNTFSGNIYYQHFYGIEIETSYNVFDTSQFTLMDFQETSEGVHFFYTLPFNERKALIETTWISKNYNHTTERYHSELKSYINDSLNIKHYTTSFTEKGVLPLAHSRSKSKKNEIYIGTSANLLRKSTGYTFLNIQEHSKFITQNLDNILNLSNFKLKNKYSFYDKILFRVIQKHPERMPHIFNSLFSKNINSVIRFLSSQSTFINDFLAILNLPKKHFIQALFK